MEKRRLRRRRLPKKRAGCLPVFLCVLLCCLAGSWVWMAAHWSAPEGEPLSVKSQPEMINAAHAFSPDQREEASGEDGRSPEGEEESGGSEAPASQGEASSQEEAFGLDQLTEDDLYSAAAYLVRRSDGKVLLNIHGEELIWPASMTKLMTGLYRDFKGEILLNGRDIRTYDAKALKSLCSAVFQDFARYQVPARASIAVGLPAREARVEDAVRTVGLRDAIDALPKGLDTPLGKIYEGGQDLSGGEWQRVAIARALVSGAPVRILDEPTAALDPMSESRFYEQFAGMSRGVTTLFISHRLGSTRLADRIFVIDGGRIAEEGTQAELLAAGGLFADMFEAQRSWYQ